MSDALEGDVVGTAAGSVDPHLLGDLGIELIRAELANATMQVHR